MRAGTGNLNFPFRVRQEKRKVIKNLLYALLLFIAYIRPVAAQNDLTTINLLYAVASLRNDSIAGTAVFVQNQAADLYLVATAHIARTMDKNVSVVIQGETRPLLFKITEFANPVTWAYHPDVDLAVLKLNPKALFFNTYLQNRFLPLALIDSMPLPLPTDSLLTILGFQPGRRDASFNPPMAYTSIITREKITLEGQTEPAKSRIVYLEKPSVSGYNGGPVFLLGEGDELGVIPADRPFRMVGFLQGKVRDHADRTWLAMIPTFYLRDLIK